MFSRTESGASKFSTLALLFAPSRYVEILSPGRGWGDLYYSTVAHHHLIGELFGEGQKCLHQSRGVLRKYCSAIWRTLKRFNFTLNPNPQIGDRTLFRNGRCRMKLAALRV